MSSDTELEARDIRAGYIAWCRGELPRDMAGEKFDRFIAKVEADARIDARKEVAEFTPTLSHFRAVYGEMCADWCRDGSLAEFDRVIDKIRADERQSLLEELTADAELEARIGEQGNDSERVNAAEKIIEMLNDIQIEGEHE